MWVFECLDLSRRIENTEWIQDIHLTTDSGMTKSPLVDAYGLRRCHPRSIQTI
jgi:hypothetical protein